MKFVIHLTLASLAHTQLGQLPLNDLVTPGHIWSQLVTWNSSSTLRSLRSLIPSWASYHYMMLVTPGHIWSQLVTNCSLVTAGHIGHTLAIWYPSGEEISARTERQTDGSHIMYRFLIFAPFRWYWIRSCLLNQFVDQGCSNLPFTELKLTYSLKKD